MRSSSDGSTGLLRSRSGRARTLAAWLLGSAMPMGCAPDEPHASPDEVARAKQVYTECVEDELGIPLEALDITPSGDITVEFAEGYTDEDAARTLCVCEPRISFVLDPGGVAVLGPPRQPRAAWNRPRPGRALGQAGEPWV